MPPRAKKPTDTPDDFGTTALGQRFCGACAVRPLDETATSWACEHGSWEGVPGAIEPADPQTPAA